VVKLLESVKPMLATRYVDYPNLIEPADALSASVLPSFNSVEVEEVPVVLTDGHEQVIVMG
jgi:hypothetical protein